MVLLSSMDVPDLELCVPEDFTPIWRRNFQIKYCTQFTQKPDNNLDTCLRIHSNKVCLIYLSKKHVTVTSSVTITSLNFQTSPKVNRLENRMSGKGKRGAQFVQPDSILCYIQLEENNETSQIPVRCGVYGKLLEINDRIIVDPNLIRDVNDPKSFVAIVLCNRYKYDKCIENLIDENQYIQ